MKRQIIVDVDVDGNTIHGVWSLGHIPDDQISQIYEPSKDKSNLKSILKLSEAGFDTDSIIALNEAGLL